MRDTEGEGGSRGEKLGTNCAAVTLEFMFVMQTCTAPIHYTDWGGPWE